MVSHQGLLIRINTVKNSIEFSKNDGRSWQHQINVNSAYGQFLDLVDNGSELLATSTKGMYYSKNAGKSWQKR
ncbi:hypothetical protein [Flavobacterium davisii]|uniref:hypothetical protein n=1 Tax=Flavobacterium davisii TaxID=2906077 RepID=UPI0035D0ED74